MNARILILGLLSRTPMHGYDIQRAFEQSRVDQWAGLQKGSIYHALKKMAAEGLLEVLSREAGPGGEKAVYRTTRQGRTELKTLLRKAWEEPVRAYPTTLYSALVFFEMLPASELLEVLERQSADLERELETWRTGERAKAEAGALPEHSRLVFENARQHLEADLRLVRDLRLVLRSQG